MQLNNTLMDTLTSTWLPGGNYTTPGVGPVVLARWLPGAASVVAASLYLIISLVGLTGNLLVLLAVALSRRLQTKDTAFVVALSVSDLLTSVTLPIQSASLLGAWSPAFLVCCHLAAVSSYVSIGSNVLLLAAIAFNRYVYVTKTPLTYRSHFSAIKVVLMIATAYVVPFSITVSGLALGGAKSGVCPSVRSKVNTCTISGHTFDLVVLSVIGVSLAITLVFYILIFVHVKRHFQAVAMVPHKNKVSVISTRGLVSGNTSPVVSRETVCRGRCHSEKSLQSVCSRETHCSGNFPGTSRGRRSSFIPRRHLAPPSTLHPASAELTRAGQVSSRTNHQAPASRPSTSDSTDTSPRVKWSQGCSAEGSDMPQLKAETPCTGHPLPQEQPKSIDGYSQNSQHSDRSQRETRSSAGTQRATSRPDPPVINQPNDEGNHFRFGRNRFEATITKNMFLVVLAFLVCLTPTVAFLSYVQSMTSAGCSLTEAYVVILLSANCGINPILYGWRHPLFRRTFVCILTRRFRDIERPSPWLRRVLHRNR